MKNLIFILLIIIDSVTLFAQVSDEKILSLFDAVDKIDKTESFYKDYSSEINAISSENRAIFEEKLQELIAYHKNEALSIVKKRFTDKQLLMIEEELMDKTLFVYDEKTVSFIRYWQSFRRSFYEDLELLIASIK